MHLESYARHALSYITHRKEGYTDPGVYVFFTLLGCAMVYNLFCRATAEQRAILGALSDTDVESFGSSDTGSDDSARQFEESLQPRELALLTVARADSSRRKARRLQRQLRRKLV